MDLRTINWVVYTTGTRDISHIKDVIPCLQVVCDRYHNNYDTFRLALKLTGNNPMVLMEDDITLCADFRRRVLEEIVLRPSDFITFFSGQRDLQRSGYIGGQGAFFYPWIQCFYWPPGGAKDFLRFSYLWRNRLVCGSGTDVSMGYYFRYNHIKYYQVVPNLVQHNDGKSEINPVRSSRRQSSLFQI